MRRWVTRSICLTLCLCLLTGMLPGISLAASPEEESAAVEPLAQTQADAVQETVAEESQPDAAEDTGTTVSSEPAQSTETVQTLSLIHI